MIRIKQYYAPPNDDLQITTVWDFPDRGSWATHNGSYRGNWSPYIPRNIIKRYSKPGDVVLDAFMGSGTTLVEAKLLNRHAMGIDINPEAVALARRNLDFKYNTNVKLYTSCRSSADLSVIRDESIDLVCTHPPYANIIKYSRDIRGDISLCDIEEFMFNLKNISKELYRVLKPNKYCVFMMGDIRRSGNVIPLGFMTMQLFEEIGFKLRDIAIKKQHNCRNTEHWIDRSIKYNFLLLSHEYLFVMKK